MNPVFEKFLDSVRQYTGIDETSQLYGDLISLFMEHTLEEFQRDVPMDQNKRGQPFGNLENKLMDILARIFNYDGTERTSSVGCSLMYSLGYTYYKTISGRWKNKMGNLKQAKRKMEERRNGADRRREELQNNDEREIPFTEYLPQDQQQQPDELFPCSPPSELYKSITLPYLLPSDDMQPCTTSDSTSPGSDGQFQSPYYDSSTPASPTNDVDRQLPSSSDIRISPDPELLHCDFTPFFKSQ